MKTLVLILASLFRLHVGQAQALFAIGNRRPQTTSP